MSVIDISFTKPTLSINLHVPDVMYVILVKQPYCHLKGLAKSYSKCFFVVVDSEQREYQ